MQMDSQIDIWSEQVEKQTDRQTDRQTKEGERGPDLPPNLSAWLTLLSYKKRHRSGSVGR